MTLRLLLVSVTDPRLQQGAGDVSSLQERACGVRGRSTGPQGEHHMEMWLYCETESNKLYPKNIGFSGFGVTNVTAAPCGGVCVIGDSQS